MIAFVLGGVIYGVLIRPVQHRSVIALVIITVGLFILIDGLVTWKWGADLKFMPAPFGNQVYHAGGVSFSRNWGKSLIAESDGWFFDTTGDSAFISRFDHDLINYSQNRFGYTSAIAAVSMGCGTTFMVGPKESQIGWPSVCRSASPDSRSPARIVRRSGR